MAIRILIADDHKLFRQGLIGLMETRENLVEVVGEAATGEEAVRMAGELKPDVILMDIYMPKMDGLEAARLIRARYPAISIVMLTSSERDGHLYEAVELQVAGYLLKNLDADELFSLLEGVQRGESAMTRTMASKMLKSVASRMSDKDQGEESLTERELLVLRLVAGGASNQAIADKLMISINTVKTHIRSILEKLQLENRTQAANFAIHRGLVMPKDHSPHPKG